MRSLDHIRSSFLLYTSVCGGDISIECPQDSFFEAKYSGRTLAAEMYSSQGLRVNGVFNAEHL